MTNLDIDAAIAAHIAWGNTFKTAIEGIDADKLNDLSVANDAGCVLGSWLSAPQQQAHAATDLFATVIKTHKDFHALADQIVGLLEHGEVDEAQRLLDNEFTEATDRIINALRLLG
jgi:hypothetical protein